MPPSRAPDRQGRPLHREHRILENDDAADQIKPVVPRELDRPAGLVVVLGGPDRRRQLRLGRTERNLTVFILDIEFEGVQALIGHARVLLELAVEARERHRHVDAPNLVRQRSQRLFLRLRGGGRTTGASAFVSRSRVVGGEETGAESDDRSREGQDRKGCHTATTVAPSSVFAAQPEPLAWVDRLPHGSFRLRPHADSVHRAMCKTTPASAG